MSALPPDRANEDRNLTRADAKLVAFESFNTDSPAVVELLLLAHNQDADGWKRYAANMALEWFDPEIDLPTPAHLEEPPALRAIRCCIDAYDPEARKQAAEAAVHHLARWRLMEDMTGHEGKRQRGAIAAALGAGARPWWAR